MRAATAAVAPPLSIVAATTAAGPTTKGRIWFSEEPDVENDTYTKEEYDRPLDPDVGVPNLQVTLSLALFYPQLYHHISHHTTFLPHHGR